MKHLEDVPNEVGLTIEYTCYKFPRPETAVSAVVAAKARTTKKSSMSCADKKAKAQHKENEPLEKFKKGLQDLNRAARGRVITDTFVCDTPYRLSSTLG